jgi:cytochrome c biogenesis protein CcmG, thiol:disulfide interchange protein DsbE
MVPRGELEFATSAHKRRRMVIAGIAVVVAGLLVVGLQRSPTRRGWAPAFTLERLDGAGAISSSQLQGAPLVVNFFASSCAPCREEAHLLERAWERYRPQGVQFLGVNVTDRRSYARDFLRRYGITYPVVTDYSLEYAQKMKVPGLPITFFIARMSASCLRRPARRWGSSDRHHCSGSYLGG